MNQNLQSSIPSKQKVGSTINRKQQEIISHHTNNNSILSKGKLMDSQRGNQLADGNQMPVEPN